MFVTLPLTKVTPLDCILTFLLPLLEGSGDEDEEGSPRESENRALLVGGGVNPPSISLFSSEDASANTYLIQESGASLFTREHSASSTDEYNKRKD